MLNLALSDDIINDKITNKHIAARNRTWTGNHTKTTTTENAKPQVVIP